MIKIKEEKRHNFIMAVHQYCDVSISDVPIDNSNGLCDWDIVELLEKAYRAGHASGYSEGTNADKDYDDEKYNDGYEDARERAIGILRSTLHQIEYMDA